MSRLYSTVALAMAFAGAPAIPVFTPAAHARTAAQDDAVAPFQLMDHKAVTLTATDLTEAEKAATLPAVSKDKTGLTYSGARIRLVVHTGPEDDMLSYRIAGVRNPSLSIPAGAEVRLLFVNTDGDMPHDIHFAAAAPPFPMAPPTEGAIGSSRLPPEATGKFSGEELVLHAGKAGVFSYFCAVRGHAKGGMYGALSIGAPPAPSGPAGHEHHGHDHGDMSAAAPAAVADGSASPGSHDTGGMAGMPGMADMPGMEGMDHGAHMHHEMGHSMSAMHSTIDLNDPMARESSGTAWVPDSSPVYARMKMKGDAMLMLHGSAFPRYTSIGGDRDVSAAGKGGGARFDAPSMFMAMYGRPLGSKSQVGLRLMTSLDPLIERGYGYPLLYQSGETYRGQALHDRQHPHDLISELSVSYSRKLTAKRSVSLYLGYPGEPALGPSTFMHRTSAMDNPDAPISHHWQDSTHITYGVATLGYSLGKIKLETSAFKGAEPDENRYNFDSPRLDSFSGRLSWNPTSDLALQVSHGYLKEPEALEPGVNQHRTTASVIWNKPIGEDGNWANTFVWGQINGENKTGSYLFETNYRKGPHTFYARTEHLGKSAHELVLAPPLDDGVFRVNSLALGYVRDLQRNKSYDVGLGTQVTFGSNPLALNTVYGGGSHSGFQVFLRLRPSRLKTETN